MIVDLKFKLRSPYRQAMKISVKINDNCKIHDMIDTNGLYINEKCVWPIRLVVSGERIIELKDLAVNNFYMQDDVLYSISEYNHNRNEIKLKLTGENPTRMFLSLKNKFIFNRINII